MLTALDDTLMHQCAEVFAHTPVSDHRFFDRTVFGVHAPGNRSKTRMRAASGQTVPSCESAQTTSHRRHPLQRSGVVMIHKRELLTLGIPFNSSR